MPVLAREETALERVLALDQGKTQNSMMKSDNLNKTIFLMQVKILHTIRSINISTFFVPWPQQTITAVSETGQPGCD